MSKAEDPGVGNITALLPRAQAGDQQAMNELLEHINPFVRRLCLPIAHGHSADAAQEAMLAIFRGIPALREPGAFYGWVRSVTVRVALRTSKRLSQSTTDELAELPQHTDQSVSVDISDVMDRLPDHHRQVLTLHAVYGMEEREMAAVLELPVGTVRSRLFRARRNFQDAWRPRSA
ncbi:RNA polymerase sigma factor [Streptomyces sp. NA04227]|uniref:RNA polymerase sigma factor n=1 Tax=Streptomyces sp. NA04227 TaxID=2742136 RepID=UPI0020CA3E66|nr:RNA polymerase sigma factor [Streptomyces sp. NA04227]